jgi:hypothetical protein
MPQTAPGEGSAHDFAGLLASLAAPPQPAIPEWNDDQLADDIATLSYEQALRTHGCNLPPASCPGAPSGSESRLEHTAASRAPDADTVCGSLPSRSDHETPAPADRCLKRASITIRLSESECAQLRLRAAETGLTVSAYLRSCTLEVESLRTQVKQALAQLRESAPAPTGSVPLNPRPWFRFWSLGRRVRMGGRPA